MNKTSNCYNDDYFPVGSLLKPPWEEATGEHPGCDFDLYVAWHTLEKAEERYFYEPVKEDKVNGRLQHCVPRNRVKSNPRTETIVNSEFLSDDMAGH